MTVEECIASFGQEVAQQDVSVWLLLILGSAAFCTGLYLIIRNQTSPHIALSLILIAGMFIIASRTGTIPGLSGSLSDPLFKNINLQQTIRAGCIAKSSARASDVPTDIPTKTVKVLPDMPFAESQLSSLAGDDSFVWVFYANDRLQDAENIRNMLLENGVLSNLAADDFSQVSNKKAKGTTRIIFSNSSTENLARAIGETAVERDLGKVTTQGPFESISYGPVQIQLY